MVERLGDALRVPSRRAERCETGRRRRSERSRQRDAGSSPTRHWKIALCSESTGSSLAPLRAAASTSSSPAATISSLFATAMSMPRSTAAKTASNATAPSVAASTISGSLSSATRSKPSAPSAAIVAIRGLKARVLAPVSKIRIAPGCESDDFETIRIARDHVERLRSDRSGRAKNGYSSCAGVHFTIVSEDAEQVQRREERHSAEEIGVEPVEHAAVPAMISPGVLDAGIALRARIRPDRPPAPRSHVATPRTRPCHQSRCKLRQAASPRAPNPRDDQERTEPSLRRFSSARSS